MEKKTFNSLNELDSYLGKIGLTETKYFIQPDFAKSVIGIANDGKLIYAYDKMVEELAEEYKQDPTFEDPYMGAIEWIDYNTLGLRPRIAYVIFDTSYEDFDCLYEESGIDEFLKPYMEFVLGTTQDYEIVISEDDISDEDKNKIEKFFDGFEDVNVLFV